MPFRGGRRDNSFPRGRGRWPHLNYGPFPRLLVEADQVPGGCLLSSPFSRGAGLVTPACLSFLSAVMRYKDLMGAASCGCFGSVHVDPWLTLQPGPRGNHGSPLYSKTSVPNFSNSWKLRPTRAQSQLVVLPSS